MAQVTITNLTSEVVLLQELYRNAQPNETFTVEREGDQLHSMPALQQLWNDGIIDVTVNESSAQKNFVNSKLHSSESTKNWSFDTQVAGIDYLGGFYDFAASDNDFSPSVNFGDVNRSSAAHFFIVTGAITVDEVQVTVTGTSITDFGVRTPSNSAVITIPSGTPVNTYFETEEKWNGQITIETTAGTPILANYGLAKYYEANRQNFTILSIDCVWIGEDTGTDSDIALLHHTVTGWTYNAGAPPTPPPAVVRRSVDNGSENGHIGGEQGSWERRDVNTFITGEEEFHGAIIEVTSQNGGVANKSFHSLHVEIRIRVELD